MDSHYQKSMEVCLLWVGPHARAGEEREEEGVVKKTDDELITTQLPFPPMPSREKTQRNQ